MLVQVRFRGPRSPETMRYQRAGAGEGLGTLGLTFAPRRTVTDVVGFSKHARVERMNA